jgi:transposase
MMNEIIRIGIDLAKNTFSLCGVNAREQVVLERTLKRGELLGYLANLPPCVVAMEAGSGAHHWARELVALGHEPKIMAPKFVAPYRRQGNAGKNDRNDARAICEAAGRPAMRFIPTKSADQQAVLVVHRIRAGYVAEHTRLVNQLRGLLAEFGIVIAKGANVLKRQWPKLRQQYAESVPELAWAEFDALYARIGELHRLVLSYDRKIYTFLQADERAQRLAAIQGIGRLTASALVATVGNAHDFKNGRQFAAWLGLTPRQYSTGGKMRLGRIAKRGDVYLRTLLIHGARSELMHTARRVDHKSRWAEKLKRSKCWNKAAVALANKHARIAWSLLAHNMEYQPA